MSSRDDDDDESKATQLHANPYFHLTKNHVHPTATYLSLCESLWVVTKGLGATYDYLIDVSSLCK